MSIRFDMAAMRELAGEKLFARAEVYVRQDKVRIASIDAARVRSRVVGNETYSVELTGKGRTLGGTCSCPAFENWPVCKHMVATALAANDLPADSDAMGADKRIRKHLKARGVEKLVDLIMEIAGRDPQVFERLDLAATTAGSDDTAVERRLREALHAATAIDGFVEYGGAGAWADGVAQVLNAIADLETSGRASLALRLADDALDAISEALGSIDDSNGEGGAQLARAQAIHLRAAHAGRPDPVALAHDLFHHEIEDDFDTFSGAVGLYANALGKTGRAAYRTLAEETWAKLPPRGPKEERDYEKSALYDRLQSILDSFAAHEKDVEARIKLRTKDLSSAWRYVELAEFCREQGRDAEALRWAEEGLWIFEDKRQDERLLSIATELLVRAGRKDEAAERLRTAFRKAPSFEL